jgi:hypothetical protein
MMTPHWLALLVPLPAGVTAELKPVASAEQLANGTAGPIAGWQSLTIHLAAPEGSRHIMVTIDGDGKILSAGDHVMLISRQSRGGKAFNIADHQSVGGRYTDDGSFQGTRWLTHTEQEEGTDGDGTTTSTASTPSDEDIAALNRIVADLLSRR